MMAYMMLGQWNEANRISQLMNQMPPQDAAVGRARALLAQAVLCIHTKQEAKPYFDRFMTEAEDARRSSLFMYHELMADYYLYASTMLCRINNTNRLQRLLPN